MLTPDAPLVLLLPGTPSFSLKNNRVIVKKKNGGFALVPNSAVTKYMNGVRATITRQLPNPWAILESGIGICLETFLYYKSPFPRSDIDNFYTTIQECLQEVVINDDRQIEYFVAMRNRTQSKEGQYARAFIWQTDNKDMIGELSKFLLYKETLTNEFGLSTPSTRIKSGIEGNAGEIAAIDIF